MIGQQIIKILHTAILHYRGFRPSTVECSFFVLQDVQSKKSISSIKVIVDTAEGARKISEPTKYRPITQGR